MIRAAHIPSGGADQVIEVVAKERGQCIVARRRKGDGKTTRIESFKKVAVVRSSSGEISMQAKDDSFLVFLVKALPSSSVVDTGCLLLKGANYQCHQDHFLDPKAAIDLIMASWSGWPVS
jgi:hypothetical protein